MEGTKIKKQLLQEKLDQKKFEKQNETKVNEQLKTKKSLFKFQKLLNMFESENKVKRINLNKIKAQNNKNTQIMLSTPLYKDTTNISFKENLMKKGIETEINNNMLMGECLLEKAKSIQADHILLKRKIRILKSWIKTQRLNENLSKQKMLEIKVIFLF